MSARRICGIVPAALLAVMSCGGGAEHEAAQYIHFDTSRIVIIGATDTVSLAVEVADSDEERSYGLMDRTALADYAGMLFVYDSAQDSTSGFWMYRTRIPLDIGFIDATGTIVSILAMDPCASPEPRWCKAYVPGVRYVRALEVNRGFFQRHGLGVGARAVYQQ